MSGGSFFYAFGHVDNFVYQLEMKLDELPPDDFTPEVVARLRQVVELARKTSHEMREAEWLFSGDTGPDSFMKRIDKR